MKPNSVCLAIILLCSLILPVSRSSAQQHGKALAFSALTINDGLSQGLVMRIFQDRYGFMWFATLDGLNRYDGYRFSVFRHDAHDPSSIAESYVQSMFEDRKGQLWIGTMSGGLDLFDRKTETFVHVKMQAWKKNSPLPGPVTSIAEDNRGQIWVQAGDDLYKIAMDEHEKTLVNAFTVHRATPPFRSVFSFLFNTKNHRVYFVNAAGGVAYKLDNGVSDSWSVAFRLEERPAIARTQDGTYRISQLLEDTVRRKLYLFHENGVSLYNEASGLLERLHENQFFSQHEQPMRACLDKDGQAWFTQNDSLIAFNVRSGKLTFTTARDSAFSWPARHSYTTFIDRSGLLWIGTSGYGALKRNSRAETFHHTGNYSLYAISEIGNGQIFFGKDIPNGKIYDRTSGHFVDARTVVKTKEDIAYYRQYFKRPITTDSSGAWLADSNLLMHVPVDGKPRIDYPLPLPYNIDYPDFIQSKIVDADGHIWLGTTEGLVRFRKADKTWKVFKHRPGDSLPLSSNRIFSLCFDPAQPKKYLWIGTDGGGLNRMELATGRCLVYRVKDGLPNDVIYGILPDDDGNLWLSSNKGISCFNPQQKTFRNFDYKDGLQSNEFNRRSYCRTKDGCLFFGGVNGFNFFYPRQILNNQTVPQILITGMKIRNQAIPVQSQGSPLTTAIYLTKNITLMYEQNFVSFEFAAMDFTNPERNQYRYKLNGLDKDWILSGNSNTATYTNLDPGTYTFLVKGSNSDGVWNENGTSIQLTILPPWYLTWWFRTAVVAIALFAAYSFYRYRLAQALKLQAIRDRIAGDLHDEVGSNLSNIYIFSNVAQQKVKANNEAAPLLQKISDYTQQSMEAMNDIVWMINTRNDRFENIMVRMRTLAAEFCEASGCDLQLDFDEMLNDIKLNMEERKSFYLIYKEAINNTAKHAGCKSLQVKMKLDQNIVTLTISDDGKGFDTANATNGNGMFNMKKRAEMLKGTLLVTSNMGEGTTLQLRFKV